jgi:lauroyl/myristoyl acyltransferase
MKVIYWCLWWFTRIVWTPIFIGADFIDRFFDGYGDYASKRYKIWRS